MQPGDFGVTATKSWVGWCIRKLTHSTVNHAFVYLGNGQIVEAQPGGARRWLANSYPKAIYSALPLTDAERLGVVNAAKACIGRPYSFLDIAALGIAAVLKRATPRLIAKRLSRPDRLICSQLVDYCYQQAGIHLFSHKLPSEVTPGDLLELIEHG